MNKKQNILIYRLKRKPSFIRNKLNIKGAGLHSIDVEVLTVDLVNPNQRIRTVEASDILMKRIVLDAQLSEVVYQ